MLSADIGLSPGTAEGGLELKDEEGRESSEIMDWDEDSDKLSPSHAGVL